MGIATLRNIAFVMLAGAVAALSLGILFKVMLRQQAKELYETRQLHDAKKKSRELLEIAQQNQDTLCAAEALQILGDSQRDLKEYRESIDSFEQMLGLFKSSKNWTIKGWAFNGLGLTYESLGRYEEAIENHIKYLDVAKQLNDKLGQGKAHGGLGNAYIGLGRYGKAIERHKKHLSIAEELGDKSERAIAYGSLGNVHRRLGQYEAAIEYHRKGLNISSELDDKAGMGKARCILGCVYAKTGQYREAIENHEKHLEIAQQLNDKPGQGIAYGNLGNAYCAKGESGRAIENLKMHLEISKELKDEPEEAHAYASLGLAYLRSRQLDLAHSHFQFFDGFVYALEKQPGQKEWRWHLSSFRELHIAVLDGWAVAAARLGKMAMALQIEEHRRWFSEQVCQADVPSRLGKGDEATMDRMKNISINTGASHVVVFKMHLGSLLTWVLSGKTGELVYVNEESVVMREHDVSEWVASASFAQWNKWQECLERAQRRIKKEEAANRETPRSWKESLVNQLIPDGMKGDMDTEMWTSIREPNTFFEMAKESSHQEILNLRRHFFENADLAKSKLEELLWKPILQGCKELRDALESDSRCDELVSLCLEYSKT